MSLPESPLRGLVATLVALPLLATVALAHDGPPYPIFVDEPVADWTLSVWVDPDVGTGTFFYYVDAPAGHSADEVRIQAFSAPADGTTPEVSGTSELSEPGEPFQQIGTLEFHHRGLWPTRLVVQRVDGEPIALGVLSYDLDVTPPGLGAVDILWFASPFLLLGALWLRVLLAQRAHRRKLSTTTPSTES